MNDESVNDESMTARLAYLLLGTLIDLGLTGHWVM